MRKPSRNPIRYVGLLGLIMLCLSACTTVSYLGQATTGQLGLMLGRKDIDRMLADPAVDDALKARLRTVREAREFAVDTLRLPDDGSYRSYVALDRDYVVWNVVAAPEFSVEPRTWCFPIAGCVPYKGFFSLKFAHHEAGRLRRAGYDVAISGASAYSTLGYLKDPVLSSMLNYPDTTLAGIIFHELAHRRVYVPGDSAFNEAYATAVQRAGIRAFAGEEGVPSDEIRNFDRQVRELLLAAREELADLYACSMNSEATRRHKQARLERLAKDYQQLRTRYPEPSQWDNYFAQPLNNADLALIATYEENVEPILAILEDLDGDWSAFHQRMQVMGSLEVVERHRQLGLNHATVPREPRCPESTGLPSSTAD